MITVNNQTGNMRDILGITDFKSGAAKTPPFRFESGYIHYSPLEGAYSSI